MLHLFGTMPELDWLPGIGCLDRCCSSASAIGAASPEAGLRGETLNST